MATLGDDDEQKALKPRISRRARIQRKMHQMKTKHDEDKSDTPDTQASGTDAAPLAII